MQRNVSIFISLTVALIIQLFLNGCSSSSPLPFIELKKEYAFSSKETITTLIIPSGKESFDRTYSRVLHLDLQSRGYKIVDANELLLINSDEVSGTTYRQMVDQLMTKKYLPHTDIIVIVRPFWERVYFSYEPQNKNNNNDQIPTGNKSFFLNTLSSYISFFDPKFPEPIKSFAVVDTAHIYTESEDAEIIYSEFPWMIAARQIAREFKDIPICSVSNTDTAECHFNLSLWVDKSYREAFPGTWKDRLNLRVLYANDILRSQLGIELIISEFKEWDSRFEENLQTSLLNLAERNNSKPNFFRIGITLNKSLKTNWTDKSYIGLAFPLSEFAVITGQPSFPEIGAYWNPIEEAITLAHEVGHLFGAIHVTDERSIMYPNSGFLSYEFDDVNRNIIESTKNNFFKVDEKQRVKNYNQNLIYLRKTTNQNSVPVLNAMSSATIVLLSSDSTIFNEPERLFPTFMEIIPDSIYAMAVLGYLVFKSNQLELAEEIFLKVIDFDQDFAEVHWYLSEVYEKLGNKHLCKVHRKIAKPYINLWVLDEDKEVKK